MDQNAKSSLMRTVLCVRPFFIPVKYYCSLTLHYLCWKIIAGEVYSSKRRTLQRCAKLQASYLEFHDRILRWTNGMLNFNVIFFLP